MLVGLSALRAAACSDWELNGLTSYEDAPGVLA